MSPLLVTPRFSGGRPSRNIFSNVPFLRTFDGTIVCCSGGMKSIICCPGCPKSELAAVWSGSLRSRVWMLNSPL